MQAPSTSRSAEAETAGCRRLLLYLIRPSRYDDDGYVVRHWGGVLPSNTLSTLNGLTAEVVESGRLAGVKIETRLFDETVVRIPFRQIRRETARSGTKIVIGLCGVQTNQFVRAADLARRFRAEGLTVLIGGFHVSGANALVSGTNPEIQELIDLGVTVVRGEVDACWGEILEQALAGTLPPVIDLLDRKPELYERPVPVTNADCTDSSTYASKGTVETSRGCPYGCSFCTIINVQGRRMRYHRPEAVVEAVQKQYAKGVHYFFFTDDNFARNPEWEAILDGLIQMRAEGRKISFMMQADMLASQNERFVEKSQAAGCMQVFLGVESLNAANLLGAGKRQNRVGEYPELVRRWRAAGVCTHAGYILGFPHDTPDSIADDIRRLRDEVGVDMASFFILTPLPGSQDHAELVGRGTAMDADLNRFDSFHAVTDHPRMSRAELEAAYRKAWSEFYTVEHMTQSLSAYRDEAYWTLFCTFLWARLAASLGEHPMMSGFYRVRERRERRAGHPVLGPLAFRWEKLKDQARQVRLWARLLLEFEEVWLGSRQRTKAEGSLLTILHMLNELHPAAFVANCAARFNRHRYTREDLVVFWKSLKRFRWLQTDLFRISRNAVSETALMAQFMLQLAYHGGASCRGGNVVGLA